MSKVTVIELGQIEPVGHIETGWSCGSITVGSPGSHGNTCNPPKRDGSWLFADIVARHVTKN